MFFFLLPTAAFIPLMDYFHLEALNTYIRSVHTYTRCQWNVKVMERQDECTGVHIHTCTHTSQAHIKFLYLTLQHSATIKGSVPIPVRKFIFRD